MERKGARIIYNDSFEPKNIALPMGQFSDLEGNKLGNTVLLEACASVVIVPVGAKEL